MVRVARLQVAVAMTGLALAAGVAASTPQTPQTSAPPATARTGLIAGQVVDANGAPVPEAIVQLTMPGLLQDPQSPRGRVSADGQGRFFFAALPAGEYYLQASKDGYLSGSFRQRRPSAGGESLKLAADERRVDVALTIWKFAAIAGRVVDEAGEPVVGIGVRALERQFNGGRRMYGNWLDGGASAVTDDRGQFRFSGLRPGTYVVGVPSTQTTLPVVTLDAAVQDVEIRNDLFYGGVMEAAPLGTRGIVQVGDFALLTLARVLVPPPPGVDGRRRTYPITYFPSAATVAAATPITLRSGDERTDLAMTLTPRPAFRISGRLVTPDGSAPPPMMLRLLGEGSAGVSDALPSGSGAMIASFVTANARSTVDGRFTFLDVPAGEYELSEANRFLMREVQAGREPYWLSQRVTAGGGDVDNLVVQLRPALRVEGRFEFAGSTPRPPILENGSITFETPFGEPGRFAAQGARGTRTFAAVAAGGRFIANPVETGGWFVQSITLDGKDITDRAFDLDSDVTTFVITYTDRPSTVSGTVKDARGAPGMNAFVLAFPVDPARRTGYGNRTRQLRQAPVTNGEFAINHLPAGDYYVVAIDDADADDWQDPARLEVLARQAMRLTIEANAGAAKTLDLTVKAIR